MAKAATTLSGLLSAKAPLNAGDEILIGHDHAEDAGANVTYDFATDTATKHNPIRVVSVHTTTEAYTPATSAQLKATGGGYDILLYGPGVAFYGIYFEAQDDMTLADSSEIHTFEDCTFKFDAFPASEANCIHILRNCTLESAKTASPIRPYYRMRYEFIGCNFKMANLDNADTLVDWSVGDYDIHMLFDGCDFTDGGSNDLGNVFPALGANDNLIKLIVRRCRLGSSTGLIASVDDEAHGSYAEMSGSYTGTDTVAAWQYKKVTPLGTVEAVSSETRSGGDEDTQYSLKVTPIAAVTKSFPLALPPIRIRVDAGSQTLDLHFASSASVDDDEFWIEVTSPNESDPATADARYQTTRTDPADTASTYSDLLAGDWSGSDVGYEMKASVSITPIEAGYVEIRAYYAKNQVICVDPKIEVS
jgi:hypothetical protein